MAAARLLMFVTLVLDEISAKFTRFTLVSSRCEATGGFGVEPPLDFRVFMGVAQNR
jgi:hypothetical protein